MNEALRHRNQPIIFRQWSRKNYAIFSSLGKEVNIGQVDIEICDKAVSKSSNSKVTVNHKTELLQFSNDNEDALLVDDVDLQNHSLLFFTSNLDESSRHSRRLTNNHIMNYLTSPSIRSWNYYIKI